MSQKSSVPTGLRDRTRSFPGDQSPGYSHSVPPGRLLCLIAAAAVATGFTARARADQIITADDNYRRVRITGFENGQVKFRTRDRQVHRVYLTDVERMVVDSAVGLKDFNEAEDYTARDEPARAVPRYERALRVAEDFWPDLILVRLLQARDRAGQFKKAMRDFIQVAERMPGAAAELIPRCVPDRANADTRTALEQIDAALDRSRGTATESVLQLGRYAICRRVDDERARRMAPDIATMVLPRHKAFSGDAVCMLQADAMGLLLEMQRYREVLQGAEAVIPDAPEEWLPAFLLLKGRALYGAAKIEADYIRAGWAFMRVVIHCGDDVRAAEALLWAARVHEKIHRPSQAVQLLRECLSRPDLPEALGREARSMLKRLTTENDD